MPRVSGLFAVNFYNFQMLEMDLECYYYGCVEHEMGIFIRLSFHVQFQSLCFWQRHYYSLWNNTYAITHFSCSNGLFLCLVLYNIVLYFFLGKFNFEWKLLLILLLLPVLCYACVVIRKDTLTLGYWIEIFSSTVTEWLSN